MIPRACGWQRAHSLLPGLHPRVYSQLMSERTFFSGEGGLEILKKRSDISILVAFSSGHFRSSGGVEMSDGHSL